MARKKTGRRAASAARRFEVKATLENFVLAKAKSALTLEIYSRDEKLGELEIGRGSLYWRGAERQKKQRIGWGRLAKMLDHLAYGESRTPV